MCDNTVRVALRIRPLVISEIEKGCQMCLDMVPGEPQVRIFNSDKSYTYNYVFSPDVRQEEFYNVAIKRLVDNIFQGYNVTILAYGQTGSGKTYSMGTNYTGIEEKGIIPRVIEDIFETIKLKEDWSFKVTVSFMELYQKQLYDLLSDKQRSQSIVDIREDGKSIKIIGITDKEVTSAQETLACLSQGSMGRVTGATAMNAHSSRSHAIFTICIYQQKKNDLNTATMAKFHLIDLAGFQQSKKTQATGERFKEGININKELLALSNVISQLGDSVSGSYIGYRDSKLTRLLQDSLGANSMTVMVACISPADYNLNETLSTLRYANRVCKIKNKPIINQDPNITEISRLNKLIQTLQLTLMNQELGITCPKEHEKLEEKYSTLQHKFRYMTKELNSNLAQMYERAEMAEQAHEIFRNSMILILKEFKQILQNFDVCHEINDEKRKELEITYIKIRDLQENENKIFKELVNYKILLDSMTLIKEYIHTGDLNNIEDSLDYFDKKEEEHTLRQAERNNEVQNINKELPLKENLVSELMKSNTQQTTESHRDVAEMQKEIERLHAEREEDLQALHARNFTSKKMGETFAVNKRLKGALEIQGKAMERQEKKANSKDEIKTMVAKEWEMLMAVTDANLCLKKLMQERASLSYQLEQRKQSNNPNQEECATLAKFIKLRNAQIPDLQKHIVKSEEVRAYMEWDMIYSIADAKIVHQTILHLGAQERKKLYELQDKYLNLQERQKRLEERLEEYMKKGRENGTYPLENTSTTSSNIETSQSNEQILTESDDSLITKDDVKNDPDWKKTLRYNRRKKKKSKPAQRLIFKIKPKQPKTKKNKCACKTNCTTRMCTCRKNNNTCKNCNCNIEKCQNR